jgi:hypothetical protein
MANAIVPEPIMPPYQLTEENVQSVHAHIGSNAVVVARQEPAVKAWIKFYRDAMVAQLLNAIAEVDAVDNLTEPVHFVRNADPAVDMQVIPVGGGGYAPVPEDARIDYRMFLRADYLVVVPAGMMAEELAAADVRVVEDVRICLGDAQVDGVPRYITFRDTGNVYMLSDGYSVAQCGKLSATGTLEII